MHPVKVRTCDAQVFSGYASESKEWIFADPPVKIALQANQVTSSYLKKIEIASSFFEGNALPRANAFLDWDELKVTLSWRPSDRKGHLCLERCKRGPTLISQSLSVFVSMLRTSTNVPVPFASSEASLSTCHPKGQRFNTLHL